MTIAPPLPLRIIRLIHTGIGLFGLCFLLFALLSVGCGWF